MLYRGLKAILASLAFTTLVFSGPLKVLRLGNGPEPQVLDPQAISGSPEFAIVFSLFEGLVVAGSDLSVTPGVAKAWEIAPDGLTYTFHVREDAMWSDGVKLTASDFIESYRRLLTPSFGAIFASDLFPVIGAEAYSKGTLHDFSKTGFEAPDPYTLIFRLRQATPEFLDELTSGELVPVPLHVIRRYGDPYSPGNPWARAGRLIGNGAFTLDQWRPDSKVVVVRSDRYWNRPHVALDAVEFYAVDSAVTEEHMFRTGQLDATLGLPPSKIAVYQANNPSALRLDPIHACGYVAFNVRRPPFDDVRVRRAFALAIDREALVLKVYRGGQKPAYSFVPPALRDYATTPVFKADIAEAKRLLAAAGYPGGAGLPPVELLYTAGDLNQTSSEALQAMWRSTLGVEIQLRSEEWKVYVDSLRTHDFQMAREGWISSMAKDTLLRWTSGDPNNTADWSSRRFDVLFRESITKATYREKAPIYKAMESVMAEEMPIMPILFSTQPHLVSPRVVFDRAHSFSDCPIKDMDLLPP